MRRAVRRPEGPSTAEIGLAQIVTAAAILVAALTAMAALTRFVGHVAERAVRIPAGRLQAARRFIQILVGLVAGLMILSTFQIEITGLLAGLGVGALIVGFALKDIIESWVSGLLVIAGRMFRVGDVIRVGDLTGVVTDLSLRTTTLKTYDRNEIILPNATLIKSNIINLTGGTRETVASLFFTVDYAFDPQEAERIIEEVLRLHPNVVVDGASRREVQFVVRIREWTTEIEALFWINEPENEEFIKSRIAEAVKKRFEDAGILPPVPAILRERYLARKGAGEK